MEPSPRGLYIGPAKDTAEGPEKHRKRKHGPAEASPCTDPEQDPPAANAAALSHEHTQPRASKSQRAQGSGSLGLQERTAQEAAGTTRGGQAGDAGGMAGQADRYKGRSPSDQSACAPYRKAPDLGQGLRDAKRVKGEAAAEPAVGPPGPAPPGASCGAVARAGSHGAGPDGAGRTSSSRRAYSRRCKVGATAGGAVVVDLTLSDDEGAAAPRQAAAAAGGGAGGSTDGNTISGGRGTLASSSGDGTVGDAVSEGPLPRAESGETARTDSVVAEAVPGTAGAASAGCVGHSGPRPDASVAATAATGGRRRTPEHRGAGGAGMAADCVASNAGRAAGEAAAAAAAAGAEQPPPSRACISCSSEEQRLGFWSPDLHYTCHACCTLNQRDREFYGPVGTRSHEEAGGRACVECGAGRAEAWHRHAGLVGRYTCTPCYSVFRRTGSYPQPAGQAAAPPRAAHGPAQGPPDQVGSARAGDPGTGATRTRVVARKVFAGLQYDGVPQPQPPGPGRRSSPRPASPPTGGVAELLGRNSGGEGRGGEGSDGEGSGGEGSGGEGTGGEGSGGEGSGGEGSGGPEVQRGHAGESAKSEDRAREDGQGAMPSQPPQEQQLASEAVVDEAAKAATPPRVRCAGGRGIQGGDGGGTGGRDEGRDSAAGEGARGGPAALGRPYLGAAGNAAGGVGGTCGQAAGDAGVGVLAADGRDAGAAAAAVGRGPSPSPSTSSESVPDFTGSRNMPVDVRSAVSGITAGAASFLERLGQQLLKHKKAGLYMPTLGQKGESWVCEPLGGDYLHVQEAVSCWVTGGPAPPAVGEVDVVIDPCHPVYTNEWIKGDMQKLHVKYTAQDAHGRPVLGMYWGTIMLRSEEERVVGADVTGRAGLDQDVTININFSETNDEDGLVVQGDRSGCALTRLNDSSSWGPCSKFLGSRNAACTCDQYAQREPNATILQCLLKLQKPIQLPLVPSAPHARPGEESEESEESEEEESEGWEEEAGAAADSPATSGGAAGAGGHGGASCPAGGAVAGAAGGSGARGCAGGTAQVVGGGGPGTSAGTSAGPAEGATVKVRYLPMLVVVATKEDVPDGEEWLLSWGPKYFEVYGNNYLQYKYIKGLRTTIKRLTKDVRRLTKEAGRLEAEKAGPAATAAPATADVGAQAVLPTPDAPLSMLKQRLSFETEIIEQAERAIADEKRGKEELERQAGQLREQLAALQAQLAALQAQVARERAGAAAERGSLQEQVRVLREQSERDVAAREEAGRGSSALAQQLAALQAQLVGEQATRRSAEAQLAAEKLARSAAGARLASEEAARSAAEARVRVLEEKAAKDLELQRARQEELQRKLLDIKADLWAMPLCPGRRSLGPLAPASPLAPQASAAPQAAEQAGRGGIAEALVDPSGLDKVLTVISS